MKRARKTQSNTEKSNFQTAPTNNVIDFKQRKKQVDIIPKNLTQETYLSLIDDESKDIILATGPAGTGKTLIAVLAAIRALKERKCNRIVITRPAVDNDEQHGFLKGTLIEKMAPWTRPVFDVIEEYYSKKEIEYMIEEGIIEVAPLGFMRGRTFKHAFIIADEMQNSTCNQMKMLTTRIGDNSRMLITGDLNQHDRKLEENGLKQFLELCNKSTSDRISIVRFDGGDIERHPVVEEVLKMYGDI